MIAVPLAAVLLAGAAGPGAQHAPQAARQAAERALYTYYDAGNTLGQSFSHHTLVADETLTYIESDDLSPIPYADHIEYVFPVLDDGGWSSSLIIASDTGSSPGSENGFVCTGYKGAPESYRARLSQAVESGGIDRSAPIAVVTFLGCTTMVVVGSDASGQLVMSDGFDSDSIEPLDVARRVKSRLSNTCVTSR